MGVPLVLLPHLSRCNPSMVKVEGEMVRGGTRQRGRLYPGGKEREREKDKEVLVNLGEGELGEEEERGGGVGGVVVFLFVGWVWVCGFFFFFFYFAHYIEVDRWSSTSV